MAISNGSGTENGYGGRRNAAVMRCIYRAVMERACGVLAARESLLKELGTVAIMI
ncbi:MAG: hypothetical protein ACLU6Y_10020 [Ruminococcus sp.]